MHGRNKSTATLIQTLRKKPAPVLGMAVGERQVASLAVMIGWQVSPAENYPSGVQPKGAVCCVVEFVHVDDGEGFRGSGLIDFAQFSPNRLAPFVTPAEVG